MQTRGLKHFLFSFVIQRGSNVRFLAPTRVATDVGESNRSQISRKSQFENLKTKINNWPLKIWKIYDDFQQKVVDRALMVDNINKDKL